MATVLPSPAATTATTAITAAASLLEASVQASSYFETKLDKTLLHHASAHNNIDWLLSEVTHPSDPPGGLISELFPPDKEGRYKFLIPVEGPRTGTGMGSRGMKIGIQGPGSHGTGIEIQGTRSQLHMQELHQVVRELVDGIYVFNQIPMIDLEPNYDSTSTCSIPFAYHDTLIGTNLFTVDYFVKSLLHDSTVAHKDKRMRLLEDWKKFPHSNLRKEFIANGMTTIQEDREMGKYTYVKKKVPFVRYPPKCVHTEIAYSQLSQHLSTGEDYEQQTDHINRDRFLQFLDHITIGVAFRQKRILHRDNLFVLDPASEVVTGLTATQQEASTSLYNHLHSYLQKQRDFVAENLFKKSEVVHSMNLLSFVSFMIYFLVTLKKQNKIIDVSKLLPSKSRDVTRTDREVPPVLPTPSSLWSPYLSENNCVAMQGGINFMKTSLPTESPNVSVREMKNVQELLTPKKSTVSSMASFASITSLLHRMHSVDGDSMPVCDVGGKSYYVIQFKVEPYYPKTPKLPRLVHAMKAELKSQCIRLPPINDAKIQEMLKKPLGPRKAAGMKTVNVSLQASIEKGLLPAVRALLKRCTQTRLGKADDSGMTMIHYAAANARPHVLSALIIAGSSLNQPISLPNQLPSKTCPVHLAAKSGSVDALSCLDRYGADMWAEDDSGWMPVHHAAFNNYQLIIRHLLCSNLSNIDVKTSGKLCATPLLLAAQNGCFDSFKCLVELGANLAVTTSTGCTVVHLAALGYHVTILKYLIDFNKEEMNVWMLLSGMLKSPESPYAEAAARSLDPLTQWKPEESSKLLKHGAIESLVLLLHKDQTSKLLAVQVLANISNSDMIKSTLIKSEAIPQLIQLLASSDRIQACTCLVLSDLAMQPDTQVTIATSGAIPQLTKLLQSMDDNVQLFSCACIGILAYDNPKNQNQVSEVKTIPILVSMLKAPFSCIKGCAADSLLRILDRNRSNQLSVLNENVIPPLVLMLRSNDASIQKSAAKLIEAIATDCEEGQRELLTDSICISLLKRMLKMRDPSLKVCGSCALWAIAGDLISNKRLIASHMGLELLVDMLTIHNEKLDFVCSEALGSLATELGDNQNRIINVGGVKPLVEVLTIPTSQRVCLSVIHTLSAICMKPALVPNHRAQNAIASSKGISILASIVSANQAAEIVRIEAACTLAKLVLHNAESDMILTRQTGFSYITIFKFLASSEPIVRLLAGYCLSIIAFNNPVKISMMKSYGRLHISNFNIFLQSDDQFYHVHSAFQIVVLSKILTGIKSMDAIIQGIKLLVSLVSSEVERTKVVSAEFAASLSLMGEGIPGALVIAGLLEPLMDNLRTNNGPVIESSSVALGYLTFNPTASRVILTMFRDNPELFEVFSQLIPLVVYSPKFLTIWNHMTRPGIPSLSLESRGGPSIITGRRSSDPPRMFNSTHNQRASVIGILSTTTINTADTTNTNTPQQAQHRFLPRLSCPVATTFSQSCYDQPHHSQGNISRSNFSRTSSLPLDKTSISHQHLVSFRPTSHQPVGLLMQRRLKLLSAEGNRQSKKEKTVSVLGDKATGHEEAVV